MSKAETEALAAEFRTQSRDAWLALVARALKGQDFEKRLVSRTADGLRTDPLYTRADTLASEAAAVPGEAPFTRGFRATNGGQWDVRQFHSGDDTKRVNREILEDLEGGATSVALHIASPGGSGLRLGPKTLEEALQGVSLDACPVALVADARAVEAGEALNALWEKRAVPRERRRGHFGVDPVRTLAVYGALAEPMPGAMSRAVRLAAAMAPCPAVTVLGCDSTAYHSAGASEAEELAAIAGTMVEFLKAGEAEGLAPSAVLGSIAVTLHADADVFLTIAKIRAARRIIARIAEAASAGVPSTHVTAVTAWRMMARRDPWSNMLRTTIATAGAALGGADAIVVLPFTYALGRPDAFARRMARNTQLVLMEESGLGRVVDPAGGSWYVEKLTLDLARKAWEIFQAIEAEGGMAKAVASGTFQARLERTSQARRKAVATGALELTGVSAFPLLGPDGVKAEPWPRGEPPIEKPAITAPRLEMARLAEPFEALRDAADLATAAGKPLRAAVVKLGPLSAHAARRTWIGNFLATGGIEAVDVGPVTSSPEAGRLFAESGAAVACICGSDEDYALLGEAVAGLLKQAGARHVSLAGRPKAIEAALSKAGVDLFIHAGCDATAVLATLHRELGAPARIEAN